MSKSQPLPIAALLRTILTRAKIFKPLKRCYIHNFVLLITDKEGTPTCHVDFERASGRNARKTKHRYLALQFLKCGVNGLFRRDVDVLDAKVSLDRKHFVFKRPNWTVPHYIIVNIEREYPMACKADLDLLIIFRLRWEVKVHG